jgi:23S rRNA (uracil1939-C5)-methyltransferase
VRDLAHGGDAVVETAADGLVFVRGALPGETIRMAVDSVRKGKIRRGALLEVVTPSPDRREPECPVQSACGGCPWMPLDVAAQRDRKRRWLEEAAGMVVDPVIAGEPIAYRRRARLHFSYDRGRRVVGYLPERGRSIVDVKSCVVLAAPLAAALDVFRAEVLPHAAGDGELHLALRGEGALLAFRSESDQPATVYRALEGAVARGALAGALLYAGGATEPAAWGERQELTTTLDAVLEGPFPGFSQSNDAVNLRVAATVLEWANPAGLDVLELYAGHGNLTVPLARAAKTVRAVEQSRDGVRALERNLASLGVTNVSVVCANAEDQVRGPADVVVLDPPRTGAREVAAALAALRPRRIVYVSCDTPTLGRDLEVLRAGGYAVTRARAFDMFPHTAHVESVVLAEPVPGR